MSKYILAHDLGTSGNKATLFDTDGNFIKSAVFSYALLTGENGSAEQRADDWWQAVCETTKTLVATIYNQDIVAVSFSGQMMGCLCVDKNGTPLHNALIWADIRSTKQAEFIRKNIDENTYYHITGHRISTSDSVTKLMWMRDNYPEIYRNTYKMLNAKDYILLKLTDRFVTEPSDASSTCMFDLNTRSWSDDIVRLCRLDKEKLPEIIRSVDVVGGVTKTAARLTGLSEGTPVVCGGGDGCCAAVGTGIIKEGVANCCLGTSSWISIATKTPVCDQNRTVFNFAHIVPDYIMPCGTMQTGGGALQWMVNTMYGAADTQDAPNRNLVYQAVEKEVRNASVGANNLLFLPYLIGERSPRWNEKAKGVFAGLTINHTRGDMLRAVMEGVGYNLDIILNTFKKSDHKIDALILIGGGARNKVWQQILCDIFETPVRVPNYLEEATSMGAAITAGVGVGVFDGFEIIDKFIQRKEERLPNQNNKEKYTEMKGLFEDAYQAFTPLFEKL